MCEDGCVQESHYQISKKESNIELICTNKKANKQTNKRFGSKAVCHIDTQLYQICGQKGEKTLG